MMIKTFWLYFLLNNEFYYFYVLRIFKFIKWELIKKAKAKRKIKINHKNQSNLKANRKKSPLKNLPNPPLK